MQHGNGSGDEASVNAHPVCIHTLKSLLPCLVCVLPGFNLNVCPPEGKTEKLGRASLVLAAVGSCNIRLCVIC